MNELNNKELRNTYGGISAWAIIGALAAFIFATGALDGYTRPLKCNK